MAAEWEIQKAIFARLAGFSALTSALSSTSAIYDFLPQELADRDSEFPYVVIGDVSSQPFDADDRLGHEAFFLLHTFSRYRGKREAAEIMGHVYDALHRHELSVAGRHLVTCEWDGLGEVMREQDGLTHHAVQRFRIIVTTSAS